MGEWRDWELPASRLPPALLRLGQLSSLHALYPGRRLKLLLWVKEKLHTLVQISTGCFQMSLSFLCQSVIRLFYALIRLSLDSTRVR